MELSRTSMSLGQASPAIPAVAPPVAVVAAGEATAISNSGTTCAEHDVDRCTIAGFAYSIWHISRSKAEVKQGPGSRCCSLVYGCRTQLGERNLPPVLSDITTCLQDAIQLLH